MGNFMSQNIEFVHPYDKKIHSKKEKHTHTEHSFVFLCDPRFTKGIYECTAKESITREKNRTALEVSDFCHTV